MTNSSTRQPKSSAIHCVGLLLAAGSGSRFRQSLPPGYPESSKLLARLPGGTPVALASARAMLAALPRVLAIVPPESPELSRLLIEAGCEVIECAATGGETRRRAMAGSAAVGHGGDSPGGMGMSLAAGARFLLAEAAVASGRRVPACLVALADMPWIAPLTLRRTADLTREHQIVAPAFEGVRGHPVGFQAACFDDLAQLDGDTGARGLIARRGIHVWKSDDAGVLRDVDTLTDLMLPDPGRAGPGSPA
jgi:molybdenum cofactor cytidylyltransferase